MNERSLQKQKLIQMAHKYRCSTPKQNMGKLKVRLLSNSKIDQSKSPH